MTREPAVPLAVLLTDRNLAAVLSILTSRATSVEELEPWDLKAALVEVLKWEGIHA